MLDGLASPGGIADEEKVMNAFDPRLRWMVPVCVVLLLVTTSAFADDQAPDPNDWVAWLLWIASRIGVPGG
jgi:hypothetical protein